MANKLIYSTINPLKMFLKGYELDERYNTKDFDDFVFPETILSWQQIVKGFCQPWQLNDTIQIQLRTNVGPINFVLKKCEDDSVVDTLQFVQKQDSENEPGLFIYEIAVPLSGYEEGCYYVELQFGAALNFILISGSLEFAEKHENSILSEFKHYEFREDIIFETGIFPSVRFFGYKKFNGPKSKLTTYEDQPANLNTLRSVKYRSWKIYVNGVPDYFADMFGGIVGCSDHRLDGKGYSQAQDELSPIEPDQEIPLRGWSIDLRERYNKSSSIFENNDPINATIAVAVNVDSKGFGASNSGNQNAIIDVM